MLLIYLISHVKYFCLINKSINLRPPLAATGCLTARSAVAGGGTATYTTHWLDTVRVTMQMSPETHRTGASCLRSIVRSAGVRGLYAGVTPALVAQTCKTAVVFMSYGVCEKLVARLAGVDDGSPLTVWHHATAGAMTAVVASFLLCPLELIKCRRQALMATAEGKGGAR